MKRLIQPLFCPQLDREIDIHILLPWNYEISKKSYPVLYFYDGDRIFDTPKTGSGTVLDGSFEYCSYERQFRKTLPELIIIGIAPPHDTLKRTAEYTPYTKDFDVPAGILFDRHIEGKGKLLGKWVASELKPWVDSRFRTLPSADATAIGGLSTSGVNAIYMISAYPQIFGRFLIHAPAVHLWIDKLTETITSADYSHVKYGYFDIGTEESTRMVKKGEAYKDLQSVMKLMTEQGLDPNHFRFVPIYQGLHDCATWKMTFPDALRYVFYDFIF